MGIEGLEQIGINTLPHLELGNSQNVCAGDEIGIMGFPFGLTTAGEAPLRQMTPITQKGVIAAVLPWSDIPNPHAFQLGMNINGGSSGSPLFMAGTGEVVGVVFAARIQNHPVTIETPQGPQAIASVPLPTGFGYAVPINRYRQQPVGVQRIPDVIQR